MIEAGMGYLERFVAAMNSGGMAMWVLFFLNLMLWYGLGYRSLVLKRGTKRNVRRLVNGHIKKERRCKGLVDHAILDALKAASVAKEIGKKPRKYIYDSLWPYLRSIRKHAVLVRTVVLLAPLVGLLGTVVGMIETFDALKDSAMFSQGDSISGGISKALFTTELGLIVAVPGLVIGRRLDRKQQEFAHELDQITDIITIKETAGEV